MRTVFDVSTDLMKVGGENEIETIKLQKLAYYTFGWYGRLTGEALFEQPFYAMKHGPVVGELLTLHAGKATVTRDHIEGARSSWEYPISPSSEDVFYQRTLEAIWGYYGQIDPWMLRDMTHEDEVWHEAWSRRPAGQQRADLPQTEIISFFEQRSDVPPVLDALMPPRRVTVLDEAAWSDLEALLATDRH